jgi:hypothetical protein
MNSAYIRADKSLVIDYLHEQLALRHLASIPDSVLDAPFSP